MNRANFFNGQRVTSSDLNYIETAKTLGMKQLTALVLAKFSHYYTGSIPVNFRQAVADASPTLGTYRGVGGQYGSTAMLVAEMSSEELAINAGWGITDNMDLVTLASSVSILRTEQAFNKSWTSTANSTMYVVAEYQEASASVGTTLTGTTEYARYTGDYRILVTAVPPTGSSQIPLAQFTSDGSGMITAGTLTDMRQFMRVHTVDSSVKLEGPAVFSGQSTLYDHIHAAGSGVASTKNPHGNTLDDFGFIDYTSTHRKDSHVSGIVVYRDDFSPLSYLGTLGTGADDYISFAQPVGAALAVNGRIVTGSITVPVYSSSAPSTGDYWVVVNDSLQASFVSVSSVGFDPRFPQTLSQSVVLGYAYDVNPVGQTIGDFYDYRNFYTMSAGVIRADFLESGSNPTGSLPRTATLLDNMNRMRFQIGKALTGSGSMWSGNNPLTSGSQSIADAYHSHTNYGNSNGRFQSNGGSTLTRAMNTTYQNTTNNNMLVTVTAQINKSASGAQGYVELLTNSGSIMQKGFLGNTLGSVGGGHPLADTMVLVGTIVGIIPRGHYYRATGSVDAGTTVSLLGWTENF
jgi:hypothetical protein